MTASAYKHKALAMAEKNLGRSFYQRSDGEFTPTVGLIASNLRQHFERIVFRITKGNAYV